MNTLEIVTPKIALRAGIIILVFIVTGILHYTIIELRLVALDNMASIVQFIKADGLLFRAGILLDLVLFVTGIIMALLLYRLLKSVNKGLALLAFVFMLIETMLSVTVELSSFLALLLVNGKSYIQTFDPETVKATLSLVLGMRADGYLLSVIFFDLSFMIFVYLLLRAKYLPHNLAILALLAFADMLLATAAKILWPTFPELWVKGSASLVMLVQVSIGVLLIRRGIRSR